MKIEPSMQRRRTGYQNPELFIPPSTAASLLNRDSISTETTLLVTRAPAKDLKLINPPWRRQGNMAEIRMAESGDSSVVDDRDKYRIRYDERQDRLEQARRAANKRQDVDDTIPIMKPINSLTLISNPPSTQQKNKGILSRFKQNKVVPQPAIRIKPNREAIELVLVSLTKDKMIVQIIDGENKTKVHTTLEKEVAPTKLNTDDDEVENDQPDVIDQFLKTKAAKNIMDAIFGDEEAEIKDDYNESASLGPDDIPHEVSYRTQPSMSSIVYSDIPPAASWPDVSDVSSNSSDASDWTSIDDSPPKKKNDSPPKKNNSQLIVANTKKKWNKKIAPLMRQLSHPVAKASSPMVKAFTKTDSLY